MRAQATEQLTILPDSEWRYDLSNLSQIMVYETAFYHITLLPILRRYVKKNKLCSTSSLQRRKLSEHKIILNAKTSLKSRE